MAACAPAAEKVDLPYLHFWRHRRAALCLFVQRDRHGKPTTDSIEERLSIPAFKQIWQDVGLCFVPMQYTSVMHLQV